MRGTLIWPAIALLLPVAVATQMLYPFLYGRILAGELPALVLLLGRNLLVLGTGLLAFRALAQRATG